jgi:hypothetical protein
MRVAAASGGGGGRRKGSCIEGGVFDKRGRLHSLWTGRLSGLPGQLEQASSDLEAASTLHALLLLIQDLSTTSRQRDQASHCGKTLAQRGILSEDYPLMKLLSFRIKPYYLPGISELRLLHALPSPTLFPHSRQSSSSSSSTTPEAITGGISTN